MTSSPASSRPTAAEIPKRCWRVWRPFRAGHLEYKGHARPGFAEKRTNKTLAIDRSAAMFCVKMRSESTPEAAKFAVVAFAGPEHTAKNRSDSCRRCLLVINIAQKFTLSKIINGGCGVLRTSKESRP